MSYYQFLFEGKIAALSVVVPLTTMLSDHHVISTIEKALLVLETLGLHGHNTLSNKKFKPKGNRATVNC